MTIIVILVQLAPEIQNGDMCCAGDKILAASRRRAFRGATIPCVNGYSGKKMMVIRVKYYLEHVYHASR